jgi:hypothetical protein
MCDLAYVNFLREKARQLEAEERRLQAFGPTPSTRFVPFVLTADLSLSDRSGTTFVGRKSKLGLEVARDILRSLS